MKIPTNDCDLIKKLFPKLQLIVLMILSKRNILLTSFEIKISLLCFAVYLPNGIEKKN